MVDNLVWFEVDTNLPYIPKSLQFSLAHTFVFVLQCIFEKLTLFKVSGKQVVNFTNILQAAFLYLGLYFWRNIGAKIAQKNVGEIDTL